MRTGYRIYPFWFASGGDPMRELAEGSAARMGRRVERIEITGRGFNRYGGFMDFDVTYSSTDPRQWKEIAP